MSTTNNRFLAWGYKTAIALALFSLVASAAYLFLYLFKSDVMTIHADTMLAFNAERRMTLLSTAVFVAMSFGFLGFALFLIQAKGEVEGSFEGGGTKVNIARMSPGLFVIACATAIIIVSISFRIEYKEEAGNGIKKEYDGLVRPAYVDSLMQNNNAAAPSPEDFEKQNQK